MFLFLLWSCNDLLVRHASKYLHIINSVLITVKVELGEYLDPSHTKSVKRIAMYDILLIVGWQ